MTRIERRKFYRELSRLARQKIDRVFTSLAPCAAHFNLELAAVADTEVAPADSATA